MGTVSPEKKHSPPDSGRRWSHATRPLGDWKIVSNDEYEGLGTFELYNLASDPGETTDLSERFPERRAKLLDALAAFRERVGVVIPRPDQ